MDYPVTLERDDNKTILVSFLDFPEAHTYGDTREEALARAQDALATIIDGYIKDKRDVPLPSAKETGYRVTMPALVETKLYLYNALRASRIRKADLAKRLNWHPPQVDRLLAMTHESKLEQLERAFCVLGKRLVVSIEDLPAERRAPSKRVSKRARNSAR